MDDEHDIAMRNKWISMTSEQQTEELNRGYREQLAREEAEKKHAGRPTKLEQHERRLPRSVCMTEYETAVLRKFGRSILSQGIKRACAMIEKYNLYDREDC